MTCLASCQAPAGEPEAPPPDPAAFFNGSLGEWVDMSYGYGNETLFWPTDEGFQLEELANGVGDGGYFYSSFFIHTPEHGGTHLDAPFHFAEDGDATDEIPLERLIGPAVVVDVTDRINPDYLITTEDLQGWEAEHGPIPDGSILLLRTGWGDRWPNRLEYLGTEMRGEEAVADLHFPGLHPDAANWLVSERSIGAIGIDTPSIDYGQSDDFLTHRILYGANIPGFENVANLDRLPEVGGFVIALPMKIEGGSGGPLRMVGFVPGN